MHIVKHGDHCCKRYFYLKIHNINGQWWSRGIVDPYFFGIKFLGIHASKINTVIPVMSLTAVAVDTLYIGSLNQSYDTRHQTLKKPPGGLTIVRLHLC